MRTRVLSKHVVKLTAPELVHLIAILHDHDEDGCYWGRKDQHYARTDRLIQLLEAALDAE